MSIQISPILISAVLFFSAAANAADVEQIAAAKACTAIARSGDTGPALAEWHRKKVRCLKDLYIAVGVRNDAAAVKAEIQERLDELESAFYSSRDFCSIQHEKGFDVGGCGTISLAPREFRQLLKRMIVNEDAGWVSIDPRLQEALDIK